MHLTLKETTAHQIRAALDEAHREVGTGAGSVFTLIVINDGVSEAEVMDACVAAGRAHPSRILIVANGRGTAPALDADLYLGEEVPGEIISLRFHGELFDQAATVLVPLVLSDSPIVAWWPGLAPTDVAGDPIGRLASRRITDAKAAEHPCAALQGRAANYRPGDTDLAWTRATQWRALLAAALDQCPTEVLSVTVEADVDNPTARLLAAWCEWRLDCPVAIADTYGPGITAIELATAAGPIRVLRRQGLLASFEVPGLPPRSVALRRHRSLNPLITEELRRTDADPTYAETLNVLAARFGRCEHGRKGKP